MLINYESRSVFKRDDVTSFRVKSLDSKLLPRVGAAVKRKVRPPPAVHLDQRFMDMIEDV